MDLAGYPRPLLSIKNEENLPVIGIPQDVHRVLIVLIEPIHDERNEPAENGLD